MNGKPRKQLAEQLDRLDTIIDALADVLPQAVSDACREGARAAVKDVLLEVLSNPELRALIAPPAILTPLPAVRDTSPAPSPKPAAPSLWARLKAKVKPAKDAVIGAVVNIKNAVVDRCRAVRDAVADVGSAAGEAVPVRRIAGIASAVGIAVGVACVFVPDTLAAAIGGLGAASTAAAVQVGCWLRRAACRVGLLAWLRSVWCAGVLVEPSLS